MNRSTQRRLGGLALGVSLVLVGLPGLAAARVVLVKEGQFKLTLPENWQLSRKDKGHDGSFVAYVSSKDKKLRVRIRAAAAKGKVDLEQSLASWEKKVLGMSTIAHKNLSKHAIEVDGRTMLQSFYLADMVRNTNTYVYRIIHTIILANRGMLYHVTGFVQDADVKARMQELMNVLSSFDILPAEGKMEIDVTAAANVKITPYTGKTKDIQDADGRWQIVVPENFVVSKFNKEGERYTARIHSPNKNVRIMIASKAFAGDKYDFSGHFKRMVERYTQKKIFEVMNEIANLRAHEDGKEQASEVRSYSATGRRKTTLRTYRIMSTTLHDKKGKRVYTLTVSVTKDELAKHSGLFEGLLSGFGSYDPVEAVQAALKAAPAPAKKN